MGNCTNRADAGAAASRTLFYYDERDFTRFADVGEDDVEPSAAERDRRQYLNRLKMAHDAARRERRSLRRMWAQWLAARRAGRPADMPPFPRFGRPASEIHDSTTATPLPPPRRRRRRSRGSTYAEIAAVLGPAHEERYRADPSAGPSATMPRNVHDGWHWVCGCTAFIRTDSKKRYVWIRCETHQRPSGRDKSRSRT